VDADLCAVRGPADEYARFLPAAAACKVRLERALVARVARPPRAAARIAMVDMSTACRIGRVHGLRCYFWHLDPQSPYSRPPLTRRSIHAVAASRQKGVAIVTQKGFSLYLN